jgi:hypothetical protein
MKKETLEEAFDRIFDSIDYVLFDYTSFEQGAKWQQQRSYSEDRVNLLHKAIITHLSDNETERIVNYLFEQFKKK